MIQINPKLINFERPSPHSTFSPSSIDRWLKCPYSIRASEGIVIPSSIYAEEGTLAHSLCEHYFRREMFGMEIPARFMMEMQVAQSKELFNIDEAMRCAAGYTEVIKAWLNSEIHIGQVLWFGLERGVPIFAEEGCFGTGDAIIVGTKGAAVIDFKYGKGKYVAGDTLQLKAYALGVYRHLSNIPEDYRFHSVVYQPRTDDIPKGAEYTAQDLHEFGGVVWAAIKKSQERDLSPVEGECHWCPARQTKDLDRKCPVILDKPRKIAEENFKGFLEDAKLPVAGAPQDVVARRDNAIIKLMTLKPIIDNICEEGRKEFQDRLNAGEVIDGVMLEIKEGNRKWAYDTKELVPRLQTQFPGLELNVTTTSLKSLTAIEKEVGKGKIDNLTIKPIKKELIISDNKSRSLLTEMASFLTY